VRVAGGAGFGVLHVTQLIVFQIQNDDLVETLTVSSVIRM